LIEEAREERLALLLRRAARGASRLYRERVADLDLTYRQAAAVHAVTEAPGMTLGALAEALGADQATASALVDRLLSAGLVRRETDPSDRRRAMLFPTRRALRLGRRIQQARRETEVFLEEALGPERAAELRRLLEHLTARLERQPEAAATGSRAP
jgi:DNA-binding MarR family transcriptional regulator